MKIKKTRLLQIIQEEIARIDEVKGKRLSKKDKEVVSQKDKEVKLYDRWLAGDGVAYAELYAMITPSLEKYARSKDFNLINAEDAKEEIQKIWLKLLEKPESFTGESALTTFLIRSLHNALIDKFRRVRDHGGRSAGADATTISDIAQTKGSASLDSLPSGSRTISQSPEDSAITKQELEIIIKKLENAPEGDLEILKYLTGAEGGANSVKDLADRLGLELPTSTGNKLKRWREKYLKENLEEGETNLPTGEETLGDRKFNDSVAAESKFLTYLNNFYKEAYQETHGDRPTGKSFESIEAANAAIEDLMTDEDAEYQYQDMPKDPDAELMEPDPYGHYELPKGGPMAGTSPNETPPTAKRRGTLNPRRPRNPVPRNKELSLEETIAAVVKETLGL